MTHEQVERKITRAPAAKRWSNAATVGMVGAFVAAACVTLVAIVSWTAGVLVSLGALAVFLILVTVGALGAARVAGIGRWRALRYAGTNALSAACWLPRIFLLS